MSRLSLVKDAVVTLHGAGSMQGKLTTLSTDPTAVPTPKLIFDGYALRAIRRFMDKVAMQPNGCWLWRGQIRNRDGYGRASFLGKSVVAYKVSFFMFRQDVPTGMELDHICRIRACVNPWHLEIVTHLQNMQRSPSVGMHMKQMTHCKRGHEFTAANTYLTTNGYRSCLECRKIWQERRKAKMLDPAVLAKVRACKRDSYHRLKGL